MRILYLGSPEEAIIPLEYLLNQKEQEIVGVVTQPARPVGRKQKLTDPPLALFAKDKHLFCLQPESSKDPIFLDQLKSLDIDVAITCAYGQILSQAFLDIPRRATINIHPSLLPKYRGATPVPATILNGDSVCGVTILFTVKKLDAGALILQKICPMIPKETRDHMTLRLFQESGPLLIQSLEQLKNPLFQGEPQDESLVSFCPKIQKEDGKISWQLHAFEIEKRFRAYHPWPGSYSFLDHGQRIAIHACSLPQDQEEETLDLNPGELALRKQKLFVGCGGSSVLILDIVCPAGSKPQKGFDFWNGLKGSLEKKPTLI